MNVVESVYLALQVRGGRKTSGCNLISVDTPIFKFDLAPTLFILVLVNHNITPPSMFPSSHIGFPSMHLHIPYLR